jgi:tetratricopeptide (TPR) repeat protein
VTHSDELPDFDLLWDFQNPAETRAKFEELLPHAEEAGNATYLLTLRSQIARTWGLQGKFDEAHAILDGIEERLEHADQPERPRLVRVRYLLERGRALNSSKRKEEALPLFEQAWDCARAIETHGLATDAAHMCALASPTPEKAMEWNLEAVRYAERTGDEKALRWLGALYNNIGWEFHEQKRFDEALDMHRKCLDWYADRAAGSRGHSIARWSVAKQLRMLGRLDEALEIQRELEKDRPDGFVHEELAEVLHAMGKADEARPYFKKAHEELSAIGWVAEDTVRIERLAKLAAE